MNRNKICPDCEMEYLPHVDKCADCGAVLLLHEEHRRLREEKKRLGEQAVENAVSVRKGDLKWMNELYTVLIDAGIPCAVTSDAACGKGRCSDKFHLIVSAGDFERAQERVTEYYMEIHPELRASLELAGRGKCPACASPVGPADNQCADCGLMLVIVEDDDHEEEGCEGRY